MAQQMSVKLSRSDASPWGFRLQGGKDFGSTLLIQKVNGGSPAERAGLQAGDAVIKVNSVEVFNMRHKEAQDQIVRAGNGFEITVQRGGSTWKPAVTPVGPSPVIPQSGGNITPVTKTSLAANQPAAAPIGTGHNYSPAPFGQQQMNGNAVDSVKSIVNKQYNTPVGIYSEETIAETLSAQAEVLAGGVLGVNFKKNERNYDPKNSEVFKMLNEIANEPRTPEPEISAGMQYFSHSSHAIGGRATSPLPGTPQAERMGTPPGQRMVTFPGHRFATLPAQKTSPKFPPMKTQPLPVMKPLPQSAVKPLPQTSVKPLPKTMAPAPKVTNGNPQCTDCERVIVGVFVRIKDKNLHVECFKCATCGSSLKNVGYYNINNKLYCDVHAKLVARQHPPAPNLEPITIPPGAQKPAGAISAVLASRAAAAPVSPQASNFAPMPFHQAPGGFSGVRPSFNAAAPAPMKMPTMPSAPAPAPFTTPAKPAPVSGKFVWPPMNQPEAEFTSQPTATPLYIPPEPINQTAPIISLFDESSVSAPPERTPSLKAEPTVLSASHVQPFPEPYAEYMTHQPVARPMSAYQYAPKPLSTPAIVRPRSAFAEPNKTPKPAPSVQPVAPAHNVTFHEDVQFQESEVMLSTSTEETSSTSHHKKFSVCSQEVIGITERQELSASMEHLSESIDTAILVSKLSGRPESPVPMEHMQEAASQNEEPRTETQEQTTLPSVEQQKQTQREAVSQQVVEQQVIQSKWSSISQLPTSAPQGWQSPLVCALTTAPERPYSPLPTSSAVQTETPKTGSPRPTTLPVSYRQLPQTQEGFIPIAQEEPESTGDASQTSNLISALTIAPDRPYSPLPPPAPPLPIKPVPFPEQTKPYHTSREEACPSPMVSALTIAPQRPYSPLSVTQAPTSVMDTVQDTQQTSVMYTVQHTQPTSVMDTVQDTQPTSVMDTVQETQPSVEFREPFNLPTPSTFTSMLAALTIAPDRPYSPLCVTQAPTLTTESQQVETQPQGPTKQLPSKIVGNVQPAVYKPPSVPVAEVPQVPQPEPPKSFPSVTKELKQSVEVPPTKVPAVKITETEAKPVKEMPKKPKPQQTKNPQKAPEKTTKQQKAVKVESQKTSKTQTSSQQSTNALSLQRQTQQRPITPKIPRPITPSMATGLQKPATIPYYQQSIGDGDFPCRSPRPGTPSLICPMTVPRTPTPGIPTGGRPITPIPHKQLDVVRSLTPVQRTPAKQAAQSQQVSVSESQTQKISQQFQSSASSPQVVVTRKTHVKEEFETFHKESTQIIEKSGTTRKCISQSEQTNKVAQQSDLRRKEVTAITDGAVTQKQTSTLQSSQLAALSQQYSYENQSNSQIAAHSPQYSFGSQSNSQIAAQSQQYSFGSQSNSQIAAQSQQLMNESQKQSQTVAQFQPIPIQAPQQSILQVKPIQNENVMSLEESQRASPLPFPNISLPEGMSYAVVDNKAMYLSGQNKQVYKLSQPHQMLPHKDSVPQFQAPTFKAPSIQKLAPKFEPTSVPGPVAPSAPAQSVQFAPPSQHVKFQPVAPQPPPAVTKPIQTPTATLPVHVMSNSQHGSAFQPSVSQGINSFTPKSSGNGFQNFSPKVVASLPGPCPGPRAAPDSTPRRASGGAFQAPQPSSAPGPNISQGFTPRRASQGSARDAIPKNFAPAIRAPGLMDPCTSPPNAGGGSAPKGGSVAGTSAPVRGRGVLNQPGARQAMCASCHTQIRGPFVTALGKTWCPNHFVCGNAQCKRELADIGFVEEKGELYCEYCFEQFIAPGCNKCSKKIKGDCLNAIGKHFHPECFACSYCNKTFGNNPFFLEDGMPYCQADWNELFTTKCFACGFPIEAGDRWVEALNNNYHSQCFNCTSCKKNLEGQSFFAKSGRPFCKAHAR